MVSKTRDVILGNEAIIAKFPFYSLNPLGRYGVMILTKHPCLFFEMPFHSSNMGRSLLIAEPINGINGQQMVVATAHFESLNSS